MIAIALAALIGIATQPAPASPPPRAQMSPQQRMEAMTGVLRARGMSANGIATIQQDVRQGQTLVAGMVPKLRATAAALQAAATAKPFSAAAFEQALRAQSALASEFEAQKTEHQVTVLRALSPADQQIYAEILARTPAPAH